MSKNKGAGGWPLVPGAAGPNTLVAERYHLGRSLGQGAVGEVFEAYDSKFEPPRVVAVKLLHPQLMTDPTVREDIKKEAGLTARFSHPNILRVIDYEIGPEAAYIVTDYAPGGSLADKIKPGAKGKKPQPLPPYQVGYYLEKIAAALDEAHSQGLVHRDIKPQNILLDKHNQPLLADFGLAMPVSGRKATRVSEIWGTAEYAAPEVWQGQVSKASDIYALGVVLYELLTGQPPFRENEDDHSLEWHHKNSPVPSLSKYLDDYPCGLDKVLARALSKTPRKRPLGAGQLYQQYKEALNTLPISKAIGVKVAQLPAKKSKMVLGAVQLIVGLFAIFLTIGLVVSIVGGPSRSGSRRASLTPTPAARGASLPTLLPGQPLTLLTAHKGQPRLAWSPDGKMIAANNGNGFKIWLAGGQEVASLDGVGDNQAKELAGVPAALQSLAWSPDGQRLATGWLSGQVVLWDAKGQRLASLGGPGKAIESLAWSGKGSFLAAAQQGGDVVIWKADGSEQTVLPLGYDNKSDTPRPRTVLSWKADDLLATSVAGYGVQLWLSSGKPAFSRWNLSGGELTSIAWSPDGLWAATAGGKSVQVWEVYMPSPLRYNMNRHTGSVLSVAWSPDGKTLLSGGADGMVFFMDSRGSMQKSAIAHSKESEVRAVAWSPDGKKFATAGSDGTLWIWSEAGVPLYHINNNHKNAYAVWWSPDGKTIATPSLDEQNIKLWQVR